MGWQGVGPVTWCMMKNVLEVGLGWVGPVTWCMIENVLEIGFGGAWGQ